MYFPCSLGSHHVIEPVGEEKMPCSDDWGVLKLNLGLRVGPAGLRILALLFSRAWT